MLYSFGTLRDRSVGSRDRPGACRTEKSGALRSPENGENVCPRRGKALPQIRKTARFHALRNRRARLERQFFPWRRDLRTRLPSAFFAQNASRHSELAEKQISRKESVPSAKSEAFVTLPTPLCLFDRRICPIRSRVRPFAALSRKIGLVLIRARP